MKNHIVFISGGTASLAVADYVKMNCPNDNILLYFTDVMWEHPDAYRLIEQGSDRLQLPLLIHSTGLNPIQLMFEKKLLFNSMIGECSKQLKTRVASQFLKKGIRPAVEKWRNRHYLRQKDFVTNATLYFGIGFDELHRQSDIIRNWKPFHVEMPLIDNNIWKDDVLKKYDIAQPQLYEYGFSHNNCYGRCVKGGQGHFQLLKHRMPAHFEKLMEQEYYLKICVSAYRYIIKGNAPRDKNPIPAADVIPLDVQERMLQELDEAFRDYFYDRAERPKLYIHPAASATAEYMKIQQYSFMKKNKKPYSLRSLHLDDEKEKAMYGGADLIDKYDIGGCGCFVN